ncbi:MAG: tetratricopeptide repeat protein, partial [Promethearchaeota archaeon]
IDERKAQLLVNKVYIYTANGMINEAYVFAQQNYYLCKEIKDESHLARAYYILGWVHIENGDIDQAIENFQKSLELREKIGNQLSLAYTLFILGFSWLSKGELDVAQKYITRSLKIRKKIGNQQDIAWTLLNLGDLHYGKSELKLAQEYYENSLLIFHEIDYKLGIIFSLMRLSLIFEDFDDPQLVMNNLEKALYYAHEVENIDPEVHVLFYLIQFATKRKLASEAIAGYLERLREINDRFPSKAFNQIYRLARALVQKSSGGVRNRKKAHAIFQQITEEEIVNYLYTRIAMINYSEILAGELKNYLGDDLLVSELTELSDSISPIKVQQSYSMVAERFLHLSKSALAEIDISEARELLRRAQYLCDFLELYKKGPTPFRIMFALFIKERSLGELSRVLNLTKGALTSQIKLLTSLDLVKVSREKQVRSAKILKKYYTIGSKGVELIKPFSMNILESLSKQEDQAASYIISLMIPRLIIKMIYDTTNFIDRYQHFLEEQILTGSLKPEGSNIIDDKKLEIIKNLFNKDDEIKINHLFLSEIQYKTYMKLWNEFNQKVQEEVFKGKLGTSKAQSTEKSKYISHITLPIKELMMLERYLNMKKKDNK